MGAEGEGAATWIFSYAMLFIVKFLHKNATDPDFLDVPVTPLHDDPRGLCGHHHVGLEGAHDRGLHVGVDEHDAGTCEQDQFIFCLSLPFLTVPTRHLPFGVQWPEEEPIDEGVGLVVALGDPEGAVRVPEKQTFCMSEIIEMDFQS